MSRRVMLLVAGAIAVLVALGAAFLFVIAPAGSATAQQATLDHVADRADADTAKVLAQQDWGDGQLVLIGYDQRGVRQLGLAFVADQLRGWKVRSYTEESVEPDDVGVGSLLIAKSEGARGQPEWSAAVGEVNDVRINRVEIAWESGEKTVAPQTEGAYMVVTEGTTDGTQARYLDKDGTEIAKVPI